MAHILDFDRRAPRPSPANDYWPEVACGLWMKQPVEPKNSERRVVREVLVTLAGAAALAALMTAAAHADPLPQPSMSAALSANPDPYGVDLDLAGTWHVGGALSGLAFYQDNPNFGDKSEIDLDNAQVWLEKTDGWWQFYVQAGAYSLPSLGAGYIKSADAPGLLYGNVPVAYAKIAPVDNFSVSAGKLPTLIGGEYVFTFQNLNIQRGLLWNQEPSVSNGVQANWSDGPFSLAVSWNDGFYSDSWNWLSGLASYGFNGGADTVAVVASGNLGRNPTNLNFATPTFNNGSIFNLLYTHTDGPWTIAPYIQYVDAPADPLHGVAKGGSSTGAAVLVNYAIDDNWKLAGRVEYVSSDGGANVAVAGPGSDAWSITLTPTFQYRRFFARLEGSYVSADDITPGFAYGPNFDRDSQTSVFFEAGVLL